jgi:thiamine-monophosphate kinase
VVGTDADLALTGLDDFGWKAMAVNLSDIAAMGGRASHALVSVVGLGPDELVTLYEGILAAAEEYGCPVVGGDLSGGEQVVVTVAVTGWVLGDAVLRSGASPGDSIWVTAPLGAAAAGLRLLREAAAAVLPSSHDASASPAPAGPAPVGRSTVRSSRSWSAAQAPLVEAQARPRPALAAGQAAREAGATAMIDVSDGFSADLAHLARLSGVGYDLAVVPVAEGATLTEALEGGEDFVLVFTCPGEIDATAVFARAGLPPPLRVGTCHGRVGEYRLGGETLVARGWEHSL